MSEEEERRIPGALSEDSDIKEVLATTAIPETPAVNPPPRDTRGCFTRRPPVPDPHPPLASTPSPPRVRTPPLSTQLYAVALSHLSTPVRNLFTG